MNCNISSRNMIMELYDHRYSQGSEHIYWVVLEDQSQRSILEMETEVEKERNLAQIPKEDGGDLEKWKEL